MNFVKLSRNPRSIASFSSIFLDMRFFQKSPRFAGILNKSNNSNESNKSYTLRGALVCDGTNTSTVSTVVVVRVVAAAIEVQVTSVVGVRRTERTRPVVAVPTLAVPICTVAPASSREEDTVAVRTSNLITIMTALGCPCPRAFITEFLIFCICWHAPTAAPVLTGGVVATDRTDARLTANLVDAPTIALVIKTVKAIDPVVT